MIHELLLMVIRKQASKPQPKAAHTQSIILRKIKPSQKNKVVLWVAMVGKVVLFWRCRS